MRVLTLHHQQFCAACGSLAQSAAEFAPDALVGILNGGGYVARQMLPHFPGARYVEVALQRASTPKKRFLSPLLKLLPTAMVDYLRVRESRHLSSRPPKPLPFALPPSASEALVGVRRILLVDDAVDSGATMIAVANALRKALPQARIECAVLAVTTPAPLLSPRFALWRNQLLLRFPWSKDYNKRR